MSDLEDMAYSGSVRQAQMQATDIINVTPNDNVDLAFPSRAIRCHTGGNVALVTAAGNDVICKFRDGETRWIIATRILATGTTAVDIEVMK